VFYRLNHQKRLDTENKILNYFQSAYYNIVSYLVLMKH